MNQPFATTEPSNAEMLANWHRVLAHSPLLLVFLEIEARFLDQGWAALIMAHLVPVLAIAAVVTFKREILACLLAVSLALVVGVKAFWNELMSQVEMP